MSERRHSARKRSDVNQRVATTAGEAPKLSSWKSAAAGRPSAGAVHAGDGPAPTQALPGAGTPDARMQQRPDNYWILLNARPLRTRAAGHLRHEKRRLRRTRNCAATWTPELMHAADRQARRPREQHNAYKIPQNVQNIRGLRPGSERSGAQRQARTHPHLPRLTTLPT